MSKEKVMGIDLDTDAIPVFDILKQKVTLDDTRERLEKNREASLQTGDYLDLVSTLVKEGVFDKEKLDKKPKIVNSNGEVLTTVGQVMEANQELKQ